MKAVLVAILWLVTIWRLRSVRQAPWKRSLWLAFFGLSVALTVTLPPVTRELDHASGIVDLATLVKHLAGIGACAAVLDWVLALNKPQDLGRFPARRHYVAATTMVAMTALFFAIDRQETVNFAEVQSGSGAVASAYLLAFEIYLGIAMGIASKLFWHASRRKSAGLLRFGMRVLAAGTALGVVYAVLRSAYLIVRLTGNHVPFGDHTMVSTSDAVQALAILLILIGTSVPAAGAGLKAVADYRALNRLRPLWKDLTGQAPAIVLGTPPTRVQDWLAFRGVRQRLLRRAIEIRDAALLLRGMVDHAEQQAIRQRLVDDGLDGEHLEACCEAAWIRSAVSAKKQQRPLAAHSAELRPHGSTDLEDEVRWLLLVAKFYRAPEIALSRTSPALAMEPR